MKTDLEPNVEKEMIQDAKAISAVKNKAATIQAEIAGQIEELTILERLIMYGSLLSIIYHNFHRSLFDRSLAYSFSNFLALLLVQLLCTLLPRNKCLL